jgi:hypothetical protein
MMDQATKSILWRQFGGAIDMLANAVKMCPESLWGDRKRNPEYWYLVYHTLFFLDYYLSESAAGFRPPAPYNLDELDPAGIIPDRVYTQEEMLSYLAHGRKKCKAVIGALTAEEVLRHRPFGTIDCPFLELLLYNMRHVQHSTAQLNLILRQVIDDAPRWVRWAPDELERV